MFTFFFNFKCENIISDVFCLKIVNSAPLNHLDSGMVCLNICPLSGVVLLYQLFNVACHCTAAVSICIPMPLTFYLSDKPAIDLSLNALSLEN